MASGRFFRHAARPSPARWWSAPRDPATDRLPLPEERSARDGTRTAIGEAPRGQAGGAPYKLPPGVGVTFTMPLGKGKATLRGNDAQN